MLEIRSVTKVYEAGEAKHKALNRVSINFRANEFVAILGPSGSGKTTLLNIIGGLDHYTSGDIKINEVSTKNFGDKDWDAYRNHRIGFVFQAYNLIPHQTVLSNVKLALTLSGISKREATRRAKKVLADVGLSEHINKKPSQLSGGQMQRVAIARALVNDPEILLADEPTGALDSDTSVQIMNLLKEIAKDKLVVMVTHNPELAEEYATRIVTLKDGEITSDSDPYDGKMKTNLDANDAKRKGKKTKMSFITALSLSLQNLLTKKGRTVLVAFAGSIGIIGIALILAVSTGFQAYIDSIEEDTLTSYPLALMRESTDVTSVLLNNIMGETNNFNDGKVHENQVLSSTLGSVTQNDLKSFRSYLDAHYDEVTKDLRIVENEYSVDPLIYTIDATGKLAQLNPNNIFSSALGRAEALSTYTSVFKQYERENMENDLRVLAGRLPEKYNEVVIILNEENKIGDLLTYSLGLHDTSELSTMMTKLLAGETVEIHNEPLALTYEELMAIKLKLLYATDLYRYNATYNVYEDMSDNTEYMMSLYNAAEGLEIVGITTPRDGITSMSGVAYLPSLTTHVISHASTTEIVKRQIENPSIDVFSGVKFGEENNDASFSFSDLVSVDESKLASAISVNLDQEAITTKTTEYMTTIVNDINTDPEPIEELFIGELSALIDGFDAYLDELKQSGEYIYDPTDPASVALLPQYLMKFMTEQNFSDFSARFPRVEEYLDFSEFFTGLMMLVEIQNDSDLALETIHATAVNLLKMDVAGEVSEQVMGLTSYLTNSFADAFGINTEALLGAFSLNFTQDELTRIVTAMFTKTEATYSGNLSSLGYQDLDEPTQISFYFASFDGKTHFMEFIDHYNDLMHEYGQESKVIEYTDMTGLLMSSVKTIVDAVSYVLIAFVSISLIVSSIMIGIITYISVYERTKEIGILRAIGASKRNISSIFNAETFIVGLLSGLFGIGISYLFIPIINAVLHFFTGDIPLNVQLAPVAAGVLVLISIILTLIGGLIPASAAAKKDPVEALRSE